MTSEKRQTIQRLFLFLVLSFAPLLIAVPILNHVMGGPIFDGELADSPVTQLVGFLGMLCPGVASILTRLLTKEGVQNSCLRANFKGNGKYYVLAVAIPLACSLSGALLLRGVYGAAPESNLSVLNQISTVLLQVGTAIMLAFEGLGEELGWRGYLMPKLEKLMGLPAAILTGGVIWGLWHAPLTCSGHNFGTNYTGFPYVGIALMCAFCVLMGCVLTWLTKRTRSVYPAAILHTVNNNSSGVFLLLLASPKADGLGADLLQLIPVGIAAILVFVLLRKNNANR